MNANTSLPMKEIDDVINSNIQAKTNEDIIPIGVIPKDKSSIGFCCCGKNSLSTNEIYTINKLKEQSKVLVSNSNPSHQTKIDYIYNESKSLLKDQISDKEFTWKNLGFQSDQPYNDFRAGGYSALLFIEFLMRKYKTYSTEALTLSYFPFALICIKLSFMNNIFFNLFDDKEQKTLSACYKIEKCNKKQMKAFAQLMVYNSEGLLIIQAKALKYLINKYKKKVNPKRNELNYMLIDPLINSSINKISLLMTQLSSSRTNNFEVLSNDIFKLKPIVT